MTPTEQKIFIEKLKNEYEKATQKQRQKLGLVYEEIEVIEKYLHLMNDQYANSIRTAYKQALNKDSDIPHFHKVLKGYTRSLYYKVINEHTEPKYYNQNYILFNMLGRAGANEFFKSFQEKDLRKHVQGNFSRHYTKVVTGEMKRIRSKLYKFKNTDAAQRFTNYHRNYPFDLERLMKFLAFTSKIDSTQEGMLWVHYFTRIFYKAIDQEALINTPEILADDKEYLSSIDDDFIISKDDIKMIEVELKDDIESHENLMKFNKTINNHGN